MARATLKFRNAYAQAIAPQPIIGAGEIAPAAAREAPDDSLALTMAFATHGGNLCELLPPGQADEIGHRAEREWRLDQGSRESWTKAAEKGLKEAAQDYDDPDYADRTGPWESAADVHYPILTQAALEFHARAYPELVRGDRVVGVKSFSPVPQSPSPVDMARNAPPSADPQQQMMAQAAVQAQAQQTQQQNALMDARRARAERVARFINWVIFYQMDGWEADTDLLILETAVTGSGFKKVYMAPDGLHSDYSSALKLTFSQRTKVLATCPRVTQEFEAYPYEIEQRIRSGVYRSLQFPFDGEDPEKPRELIEQHRMEDLDGDGLAEPYVVTVDVETRQTLRIEAAYGHDDLVFSDDGRIARIDRLLPYPEFKFLVDPQGGAYGLGLGKLLENIGDTVNATINQLLDAGNAQITGGGFIGGGVRLQGQGVGGALYFQPGEFQVVNSSGIDLRQAIWERTVPQPSAVAFQMLEFMLAAAKDIASVKDVATGDTPTTAPVGTTIAVQQQALQVFSSIYKRMYRGFRDEFRLMFKVLRRYARPEDKARYAELTGGDFDSDFVGDGTDIQPVADPTVVTKMQRLARFQSIAQFGESPVGQAAGMTQAGPAQQMATDFLSLIDVDEPQKYIAEVSPNPELVAKVGELQAATQLKKADAMHRLAQVRLDDAKATEMGADTVETMGRVAMHSHGMRQEAARVGREGVEPPPDMPVEPGEAAG